MHSHCTNVCISLVFSSDMTDFTKEILPYMVNELFMISMPCSGFWSGQNKKALLDWLSKVLVFCWIDFGHTIEELGKGALLWVSWWMPDYLINCWWKDMPSNARTSSFLQEVFFSLLLLQSLSTAGAALACWSAIYTIHHHWLESSFWNKVYQPHPIICDTKLVVVVAWRHSWITVKLGISQVSTNVFLT